MEVGSQKEFQMDSEGLSEKVETGVGGAQRRCEKDVSQDRSFAAFSNEGGCCERSGSNNSTSSRQLTLPELPVNWKYNVSWAPALRTQQSPFGPFSQDRVFAEIGEGGQSIHIPSASEDICAYYPGTIPTSFCSSFLSEAERGRGSRSGLTKEPFPFVVVRDVCTQTPVAREEEEVKTDSGRPVKGSKRNGCKFGAWKTFVKGFMVFASLAGWTCYLVGSVMFLPDMPPVAYLAGVWLFVFGSSVGLLASLLDAVGPAREGEAVSSETALAPSEKDGGVTLRVPKCATHAGLAPVFVRPFTP
mmetsp:Transcript_34944/g.68974  ORF Transcript_34944/g.68974 Transcript_34944/m.68974 type:complete len:302 (-) Transcript_34944:118-1023(-)